MKNALATLRTVLTASLLLAPISFALYAPAAHAEQAASRSVSGDVKDKDGNAVKGAVVHLKDSKSLAQRSYITAEDGQFKFGQLSTSTDYEIWADLNGAKSSSKTISSFDNKNAVTVSLKMQ